MNLPEITQTAVEIARAAGEILLEGYHAQKTINLKSSAIDLVTEYDHRSEALIVQQLQAAFPAHRLIGEEGAAVEQDSPYIWYIDPIDGTTNFAHGIPFFCVSLALYAQDTPLIGVIYNPILDECFTAAAGFGAQLITKHGNTPLQVTEAPDLRHSVIATGFPYDRYESELDNIAQASVFIKRVQGFRRLGSAALDLAYVAAGRFDGYWEYKLNIWDVGAGVLLVKEAGGRVSHIADHQPFKPAAKVALVASNPYIHQEMLTLLDSIKQNKSEK